MALRDRIVDARRVPASELIPHPENWRIHPERQRRILSDMARQRRDDTLVTRTLLSRAAFRPCFDPH